MEEFEKVMRDQVLRYDDLMPALLADLHEMGAAPRFKVHGELHLQFHEACIWVLLAEKDDARAALVAMRPVLIRHQARWPNIKMTLSFNAIEGDMRIYIAFLEGPEIHDAQQLADLGCDLQSVPLSQHDRSFWEIDSAGNAKI
jgi:hypothetical protein